MTELELAECQQRLLLLSPFHVQEEYKVQIERCKFQGDIPPSIWKVLWKQRR